MFTPWYKIYEARHYLLARNYMYLNYRLDTSVISRSGNTGHRINIEAYLWYLHHYWKAWKIKQTTNIHMVVIWKPHPQRLEVKIVYNKFNSTCPNRVILSLLLFVSGIISKYILFPNVVNPLSIPNTFIPKCSIYYPSCWLSIFSFLKQKISLLSYYWYSSKLEDLTAAGLSTQQR